MNYRYKYKHIALGGTFDLLHAGHKSLLLTAFKNATFVSIGITSDKMNKVSARPTYQNQGERVRELRKFLRENKLTARTKILTINDVYGTTLSDKSIEALIVSEETSKGAKVVNSRRRQLGLVNLSVIVCPQILAWDKKPISSGRIRAGEIDREGRIYYFMLKKIAGSRLGDRIRKSLKKPFGKIVKTPKKVVGKDTPFVGVGDITVSNFVKNGIYPWVSIVDFFVTRKRKFSKLSDLGFTTNNPDVIVKNPPGLLASSLLTEIAKAFGNDRPTIIKVDGEEDLAAIPAILFSPLGKVVFYGQPQEGLVKVVVDEEIKSRLYTLLKLAKYS